MIKSLPTLNYNTPRFKAALFDLDGTLIEFKFKVRESRIALIELLRRKGFNVESFNETTKTQPLIEDAERQWKTNVSLRNGQEFIDVKRELYDVLDRFEMESIAESRPYSNALAVLQQVRQRGVHVGIVTNSGRKPVDSIIYQLGFAPLLSILITRDEMRRLKPAPDGLQDALEKLRVLPQEAIYVGDSVLDIDASRAAGMKCAAIATGLYNSDALKRKAPDFLLGDLVELESILFD